MHHMSREFCGPGAAKKMKRLKRMGGGFPGLPGM